MIILIVRCNYVEKYVFNFKEEKNNDNTNIISIFDVNIKGEKPRGFRKLNFFNQVDGGGIYLNFEKWNVYNNSEDTDFIIDGKSYPDLYPIFNYLICNISECDEKDVVLKNDIYPYDKTIKVVDDLDNESFELKFQDYFRLGDNGIYISPNGLNGISQEVIDNFFEILSDIAKDDYEKNDKNFFEMLGLTENNKDIDKLIYKEKVKVKTR